MQLAEYLAELAKVKALEPKEEKRLWRAAKNGDEQARRRIIEAYQPLVFKQAIPYRTMEAVMDLIQEGTVGLIEAVERYDPMRGVAFSLFAVHRIRGRMMDFLAHEGRRDLACMEGADVCGTDSMKDRLVDTAPSAQEFAEWHELTNRLHQAMDRLPGKERAVLEGVYLRSEPVSSVADALDVSASHIYRLQQSGVRRIRGMLSRFIQHWK
ncbi:MAG: sigma-70 family RNA polymerase sigma factor [Mitsuokella sp.]